MGTCDERRILKIMQLEPYKEWSSWDIAQVKKIWEADPCSFSSDRDEKHPVGRWRHHLNDVENWLSILASKRWNYLVKKTGRLGNWWVLTAKGRKVDYRVEEG